MILIYYKNNNKKCIPKVFNKKLIILKFNQKISYKIKTLTTKKRKRKSNCHSNAQKAHFSLYQSFNFYKKVIH